MLNLLCQMLAMSLGLSPDTTRWNVTLTNSCEDLLATLIRHLRTEPDHPSAQLMAIITAVNLPLLI